MAAPDADIACGMMRWSGISLEPPSRLPAPVDGPTLAVRHRRPLFLARARPRLWPTSCADCLVLQELRLAAPLVDSRRPGRQ